MVCKLGLNQKLIARNGLLKANDVLVSREFSDESKRFKMVCCLNCGELFKTTQESQFIFCSADCSTEYFKRKRGLI